MDIYIALLICVILCCLLEHFFTTINYGLIRIKTEKISFYICFLFILFLGIFRHELLGVDVANYKMAFGWYSSYDYLSILNMIFDDNGYILLNKIIGVFTTDFWIAKTIFFFITFGGFSWIIYHQSKYPALSYLIFLGLGFLGFDFCILRQSIALVICFYSFKYIKEKNYFIFILAVVLATTFHKTAIFYLLLYPIANQKFKNIGLIKKVLLFIMFAIGSLFIFPLLTRLYINDYSSSIIVGEGINLLIVYMVIIFIQIQMKKEAAKADTKLYDASCGVVYFQVGSIFFSLFSRVTMYFSILLTLSIPNLLYNSRNKKVYFFIIISIFTFLFLINLIGNSTRIVPYLFNF